MLTNSEIERFFEEDMQYGDITSEFIPDKMIEAEIIARESGVLAGLEEAMKIFQYFGLKTEPKAKDGSRVRRGEVVLRIRGSSRRILQCERLALNFISKMSGIATLASKYAARAKGVRIAGTRKTTPGFRKFEKKALMLAGCDPHRFCLSDAVLIKNNHIAVAGLENAIKNARQKASFTKKIEVEVESVEDAIKAAKLGVDIIMFDNMTTGEIKRAVAEIKKLGLRERLILEASGGITLDNIASYAKTGVDVLSIGALIHSSPWLNFCLRLR